MKSTDPNDQTNLLIAVVLSMAVMGAWQFFVAGPQMKEEEARRQRQSRQTQEAPALPPGTAPQPGALPQAAPGQPPSTGAPGLDPAFVTREAALASSPRVAIETPSIKGSISLKGGRIDDLVLTKYREKLDPNSPKVVLFSPLGAHGAYFAEHGWQSAGSSQKVPGGDTEWRLESGNVLTPASPITVAWDNGQGLVFRRAISVDENYMFSIADEVENKSPGDVTLTPYGRIYRVGTPKIEGFIIQHEGMIGVPGEGLEEITYAGALEDGAKHEYSGKTGGWVGFTDKYWGSALVPPQSTVYSASFNGQPRTGASPEYFWSDYRLSPMTAGAGQRAKVESHLFAGAKQVHVVNGYEEKYGIERFGWLVDWGYVYFLTKPLFYVLDWLYQLLGNFGVAILAVTVIVKAAFFPLANKSYESMAKMKKMQPEVEKLRERYKDDKARQQQEMMALYQKAKINPLAGCLPILFQIPVFFALYKVIYISIDMRHAPFFGWIQDLSAPDPTSLFNLFGLLPFAAPESYLLGYTLGFWPLLMGATMWLQMQLNPPQPDPTQQMIFNWMPVLLTFLLANFPAGLVIYWTWSNILSLAQQRYIMKSQGADVALLDNLQRTLAPVTGLAIWKRIVDAAKPLVEKAKPLAGKSGLDRFAKSKSRKMTVPPKAADVRPRAMTATGLGMWKRMGEAAKPLAEKAKSLTGKFSRDRFTRSKSHKMTVPPKAANIPPRAMTTDEALSTLGLEAGASRRDIEAAYKRRIKNGESGGKGPSRAVPPEIHKARDVLLRNGRA